MRESEEHLHRSTRVRTTCAGLGLVCFLATAFRAVDGLALQSPVPHPSSAGMSRLCNPPPHATMEDMKLAVDVLHDTTQTSSWGSVAWYLGELGYPECFEPLRDFVWGAHAHSDSVFYMSGALSSAQVSIGHLAASNPQALQYLIQSTNPAFWKSLPWKDPRRTGPELWLSMSEASIKALGLSGAPEAGQMLARLRKWPYKEAQRASIEDAIQTLRRVSLQRGYSPSELRRSTVFHLREILAPTSDGLALTGAWRWMRSTGWGSADHTPPTCGWSRTLLLEQDSTYSLWEKDSVGAYRVCSGRFIVHTSASQPKGSWIEFQDWEWDEQETFWLQFHGPDLLRLRPGGAKGVWHGRGWTHTLARERERIASPEDSDGWQPPRVCRLAPISYHIEMPLSFQKLLANVRIRPWNLSYPGALAPKGYEYTHYQIPSGVIGDFDGDSLADVAVYGHDDDDRNAVVCILSNRGSPRETVAWREPAASGHKDMPTRPAYHLELRPSGRSFVDSRGIRTTLTTDGICGLSMRGDSWMLYYANGDFHHKKLASAGSE
jgi:hypothetical protein